MAVYLVLQERSVRLSSKIPRSRFRHEFSFLLLPILEPQEREIGQGIVTTELLRYHVGNDPAFPDVKRQQHGCEGAGALDASVSGARWC